MSEMFLDKTLVSIVLFPWLQWIFLKAVASVKKQVASFAGISSHAITEGFYLVSVFSLEESISLIVLLALLVTLGSLQGLVFYSLLQIYTMLQILWSVKRTQSLS